MGLGYIPYSEISAWLDEHRIYEWEERLRYRHFITLIDGKFIELESEKSKKRSNASKASNKKPPRR